VREVSECLSEDKKNPPFIPLCKRGKEGDLNETSEKNEIDGKDGKDGIDHISQEEGGIYVSWYSSHRRGQG
jgi:hypothetical protein